MLNGLCSKFPKAQVLYAVQLSVDYGLKESIKHHNPNYNLGFNVLGVLSHHTCQNLLAEVEETTTPSGRTVKGPLRPERKFLMEEWMLGVASGIEARVLYGKPMSETTKVSADELLESIYATCRANPTEYVFMVVHDQELANIKAASSDASSSLEDTNHKIETAHRIISPTTPGMPGIGFVPGGPPVEQFAIELGRVAADPSR